MTTTKRNPINAICLACGESGHDIKTTGCDKAVQQPDLLLKDNQKKNQQQIAKATEIYKKFQYNRHSKQNFDRELLKYRDNVKVFQLNSQMLMQVMSNKCFWNPIIERKWIHMQQMTYLMTTSMLAILKMQQNLMLNKMKSP